MIISFRRTLHLRHFSCDSRDNNQEKSKLLPSFDERVAASEGKL